MGTCWENMGKWRGNKWNNIGKYGNIWKEYGKMTMLRKHGKIWEHMETCGNMVGNGGKMLGKWWVASREKMVLYIIISFMENEEYHGLSIDS